MLVQCRIADTLIVTGIPSHTEYKFTNENNHIVDVVEEDVPDLLSKTRIQGGCCGHPKETIQLFSISQ